MNEGASLLTTAQLKERGWTSALVKKFLGAPDATKSNPYYRSTAPMQLYALVRVEACEQEDGWKQAAAKAAARSLVGKTVAARKAAELVAQAETLPITVRRLPLDTLLWFPLPLIMHFTRSCFGSAVMTTSGRANRVILHFWSGSR